MTDPGKRKRQQKSKTKHRVQLSDHLHLHWSPHQARHIKPPFFFSLQLRLTKGATCDLTFLCTFSAPTPCFQVLASASVSINLHDSSGIPSRATWNSNCLFLTRTLRAPKLRYLHHRASPRIPPLRFIYLPANQPELRLQRPTYYRRGGRFKTI